jgi:hypothetical protein
MTDRRRPLILAVLVALCLWPLLGRVVRAAPPMQGLVDLTLETLRNAEYRTQSTISRTVQLSDGRYEDPIAGLTITLTDYYALGDLNKDGVDDAAVILASTTPDDELPLLELAAVTNNEGTPAIGGLILLGRGVRINELSIVNGAILLDLARPQVGDEPCCPSRQVTTSYVSRRGLLVPLQTRAFGLLFPYQQGGLYGYVNVLGETVIEPQFVLAGEFAEGLAPVSYDGRTTGYINQIGEMIVEPRFSYGGPFRRGMAIVGLPGPDVDQPFVSAYIDRLGRFVFGAVRFASTEPFSEGLAAVSYDGEQYGYIDLLGNLVIPPSFTYAESFREGLAPVRLGESYGFIDRAGSLVIEPQFQAAAPFSDGYAQVVLGDKTGYVDHAGRVVIEPVFDFGGSFVEGRAAVARAGQLFYLDDIGTPEIALDNATAARDFSEGLAAVAINGQYGYIDLQGNFVIAPQFSYVGDFKGGLAVFETPTSWGLINSIGEVVLELERLESVAEDATTVTAYTPNVPTETRSGFCTAHSDLLALPTAWRCTVEEEGYDPCLVADDGASIVCGASPMDDAPGFAVALTEPLPDATITAQPPSPFWQVRTADHALCTVSRHVDLQVDDQPVTHVCDDGAVLLGEVDRSATLWTVEKGVLVNNDDGSFSMSESQPMGIVRAWQAVEPQ